MVYYYTGEYDEIYGTFRFVQTIYKVLGFNVCLTMMVFALRISETTKAGSIFAKSLRVVSKSLSVMFAFSFFPFGFAFILIGFNLFYMNEKFLTLTSSLYSLVTLRVWLFFLSNTAKICINQLPNSLHRLNRMILRCIKLGFTFM